LHAGRSAHSSLGSLERAGGCADLKTGMTQEKSAMPTLSMPKLPALMEMPMAVSASRVLSPRVAL